MEKKHFRCPKSHDPRKSYIKRMRHTDPLDDSDMLSSESGECDLSSSQSTYSDQSSPATQFSIKSPDSMFSNLRSPELFLDDELKDVQADNFMKEILGPLGQIQNPNWVKPREQMYDQQDSLRISTFRIDQKDDTFDLHSSLGETSLSDHFSSGPETMGALDEHDLDDTALKIKTPQICPRSHEQPSVLGDSQGLTGLEQPIEHNMSLTNAKDHPRPCVSFQWAQLSASTPPIKKSHPSTIGQSDISTTNDDIGAKRRRNSQMDDNPHEVTHGSLFSNSLQSHSANSIDRYFDSPTKVPTHPISKDKGRSECSRTYHHSPAVNSSINSDSMGLLNLSRNSHGPHQPHTNMKCQVREQDNLIGSSQDLQQTHIELEAVNDGQDPDLPMQLPEVGGSGLQDDLELHLCQVCEDIAAGFHCGAHVCEACKKFFVRCLKQDGGVRFLCSRNKSCDITKDTRTQCQYCRYKKCISLGMYKPGGTNVSSEIGHIPCKVCGAPSSGYHFGAITCEGCKGFFRRTIKERDHGKYQCAKDGCCAITTATRNICKFCRYQKCLEAGMKSDGSRIGRQPNSVKHATMVELQNIKSNKGLGNESLFIHPPLMPHSVKEEPVETDDQFSKISQGDFGNLSVDKMLSDLVPVERRHHHYHRISQHQNMGDRMRVPSLNNGSHLSPSQISPPHLPYPIPSPRWSTPFHTEVKSNLAKSSRKVDNLSTLTSNNNAVQLHRRISLPNETVIPCLEDLQSELSERVSKVALLQQKQYRSQSYSEDGLTLPLHSQLEGLAIPVQQPGPAFHSPTARSTSVSSAATIVTDGIQSQDFQETSISKSTAGFELSHTRPNQTLSSGVSPQSSQHQFSQSTSAHSQCPSEPAISASPVPTAESKVIDPKLEPIDPSSTEKKMAPAYDLNSLFQEYSIEVIIERVTEAQKELDVILIKGDSAELNNKLSLCETWNGMMEQFKHSAFAVLKFAKKLPGFKKIPMDEQISLIQIGMFPLVLTMLSKQYDTVNQKENYFNMTANEKLIVMTKFPPFLGLLSSFHDLGNTLQRLQMTPVETGFLCALFLLADTKNKSLQEMFALALEEYTTKHLKKANRMGLIMLRLGELERANLSHQRAVFEIISQPEKYPGIEIPQLFQETFIDE